MKKICLLFFALMFLFSGSVFAETESNLISDIATLRCFHVSFSEKESRIDVVVDKNKINLNKSTVGVAVIPKEGYTVEYEYVSDNGGEGSTTGFTSTNTSKYTLLSTGVDTEKDGGGSAGTIPVKIFKRSNGTVMVTKVTISDGTVSKVYKMTIVVRDVAVRGNVDIADVKPIRSNADSFVVDNELKTISFEAEPNADTCGFAVNVGNGLDVLGRPRKILTGQAEKSLGYGTLDEETKVDFDRSVIARKSAGVEQTFKVKVFGGEKGLTYCWYTVNVKFPENLNGNVDFADLLTLNAESCEYDDNTKTIDVFYSSDYVAVAPVLNNLVNLTADVKNNIFITAIEGTYAIGVYAENGENQTTRFTLSTEGKSTVYTVNFHHETVE